MCRAPGKPLRRLTSLPPLPVPVSCPALPQLDVLDDSGSAALTSRYQNAVFVEGVGGCTIPAPVPATMPEPSPMSSPGHATCLPFLPSILPAACCPLSPDAAFAGQSLGLLSAMIDSRPAAASAPSLRSARAPSTDAIPPPSSPPAISASRRISLKEPELKAAESSSGSPPPVDALVPPRAARAALIVELYKHARDAEAPAARGSESRPDRGRVPSDAAALPVPSVGSVASPAAAADTSQLAAATPYSYASPPPVRPALPPPAPGPAQHSPPPPAIEQPHAGPDSSPLPSQLPGVTRTPDLPDAEAARGAVRASRSLDIGDFGPPSGRVSSAHQPELHQQSTLRRYG